MVDAAMAVKAGQLLAVDLFVLIEQSVDGREALACIVYDAQTGVRLCDESLTGDGVETIAGDIVSCVELAAKKRSAGLGKLQTLSIVGVRNADLPRAFDTQCQSLAMLLERELIRSGNVALLERTRLAWLQQEQNLTATPGDKQLLSSILQADLEFSRVADGVRATVIVTDASGRQVHKATSEAKRLDATLLAPLMDSVLRGLHAKPTDTPTNGLRESQRFFREAQLRWSFKEPTLAIQSAEAALLLDSQNADRMLLLAEYLLQWCVVDFRSPKFHRIQNGVRDRPLPLEECLSLAASAQRAFELYESAYVLINPGNMDELTAIGKRTASLDFTRQSFFSSLPGSERFSEDQRGDWIAALRELSNADWRISREHISRLHRLTQTRPATSFAYSLAVSQALPQLERHSLIAKEAPHRMLILLDEWLTCFDSLPKGQQPLVYLGIVSAAAPRSSVAGFDPQLLEPFLVRLERHPLPLLQLYGRLGRLRHKWHGGPVNPADRVAGLRPLRVDLFAFLDRPENKSDVTMRRACYAFLANAYSDLRRLDESPEYEAELAVLCEAMTARSELHPGLFLLGASGSEKLPAPTARQTLARIDAAVALSRQPNVSLVDNSDPQATRQSLERARADFLVRHRDLLSDVPALRVQTRLLIEFPKEPGQLSPLSGPKLYAPKLSGGNVVGLVMSQRVDAKLGRPVVWMQAVSIPLGQGQPEFRGEVATSLAVRNSTDIMDVVTAACVHDGRYYAAIKAGLLEFDLGSSQARLFDMSQKFPAARIQSLTSFDGRLWLGLEGGYLVSFAPRADDVRVLVSSRRKEKLSPLDDREAFKVIGIVPDPDRHRLLFLIRIRQNNKTELAEFWEYRRRSDDFHRLLEFTKIPAEAISDIQDDRLVISAGPWAVSFDLSTNRTFVVANDSLGPNLAPNRQHFIRLFVRQPVICADRLWYAQGQTLEGKLATLRLEVDDEQSLPVDLPPLDKDEIYAGWYVAPVDNKRFLWSNHHRLWLVTPGTNETKPPTPGQ